MTNIESDFLTAKDLTKILRLNKITIYRRLKEKEIPGVRIGRQWRTRKGDLVAWMKKGSI